MKSKTMIFMHLGLFSLLVAALALVQPAGEHSALVKTSTSASDGGRMVVVIVDSLPIDVRTDPGLMPGLHSLAARPDARWLDVRSCSANFTLPCIQTMLEGRESPFAAGLHNYTGTAGAEASLPGLAAIHDKRVLLISDHTLGSLYGRYADKSLQCHAWPVDHSARDIRAIQEAKDSLAAREADLVLLHFVGTDHISHVRRDHPKAFRRHYQQVSKKLVELAGTLDFTRDHLLITGDHGHDDDGHHTRQCTSLFIGPRFMELFGALRAVPKEIQQRDMLYWISYPLGFPLPPGYEGDYPALDPRYTPPLLKAFEKLQQKDLLRQGFPGKTLAEQAGKVKAFQAQQQTRSLMTNLPFLLCYIGLLLGWMVEPRVNRRLLLLAGFALLAVAARWVIPYPLLSMCLVGAALVAAAAASPQRRRLAVWLLAALLTAALAYYAAQWSQFFHSRGAFRPTAVLFYGQLLLVGALLAWIGTGRGAFSLKPPEDALSPAGGVLIYCLFCLPNGVYYYQSGTNMLQGFVGASVIWALVSWARSRRPPWEARPRFRLLALALAGITLPFLYLQDAGGWEWRLYLTEYLDQLGIAPTILAYYLAGLAAAWMLPGKGARVIFLVLWAATHAYCVGFAEQRQSWYVGSVVPVVFLIGWGELSRRAAPVPIRRLALVSCAALCTTIWFTLHGFFLARAEFAFAMPLVEHFDAEWKVFGVVFLLSALKYALPVILAVIYLRLREGAERFEQLIEGLLLLLQLKLGFLILQMLVGGAGAGEDKLYELAIGDWAFVAGLFVLLGIVVSGMILASLIAGAPGAGTAGQREKTASRSG